MPVLRTLLACLLLAATALGADAPKPDVTKLRTLSGKVIEGELKSLTEQEVVIKDKEGDVTTPLKDVLDIDFQHALGNAPPKYSAVTLNDGTLFHCEQFTLKNKDVTLKLFSGQEVKLPLSAVATVFHDAQDAGAMAEWQKILSKQGNRDILAVKKNDVLNQLPGTLGEGDDAGETIGFELEGADTVRVPLARAQGLSFFRRLDPSSDLVLCRVHDTARNVLVARKVVQSSNGFTVTTMGGVTIEFTAPQLSRLDFSKGKLTFLSDLEPIKRVETQALGGIDQYRRDKNLDGGPLRLAGKKYDKGLAIHATAELVYDIGGEYKEFKTILGVDDQVGGDSHVKITIEGDGRELFSTELKRKDNKTIPVALDVRNVKQLRILVRSANLLDLGDHVDFAEARVSK